MAPACPLHTASPPEYPRTLALAIRRPWLQPGWEVGALRRPACALARLVPALARSRLLRPALGTGHPARTLSHGLFEALPAREGGGREQKGWSGNLCRASLRRSAAHYRPGAQPCRERVCRLAANLYRAGRVPKKGAQQAAAAAERPTLRARERERERALGRRPWTHTSPASVGRDAAPPAACTGSSSPQPVGESLARVPGWLAGPGEYTNHLQAWTSFRLQAANRPPSHLCSYLVCSPASPGSAGAGTGMLLTTCGAGRADLQVGEC